MYIIVRSEQTMSSKIHIDLNEKELAAIKAIRNSLIHGGTAPSMRELMRVLGYKSPYSVLLILQKLAEAGFVKKEKGKIKLLKDLTDSKTNVRTINIPIMGSAPCGTPFFAEENIETFVPVAQRLIQPNCKYFLLRAIGDSMNLKGINDGDLVLVRQQNTAENGDIIIALIDDQATIKEFQRGQDIILLRPNSTNKKHNPIILDHDFLIQGRVTATIPNFS